MTKHYPFKSVPLTPEELKGKYKEVEEEMQEVLKWKEEEESKLKKDSFKNHQSKSSCKRNLKKANRRVNSVNGMLMYWKHRINGMSHFLASIELNEYWAMLKEKVEEKLTPKGVPQILEGTKKK